MINIDGYLIDKNEVLMVWPDGKILLRNHGAVNISSEAAKILVEMMASRSAPKALPTDTEHKESESPLPTSSSSRSQSFDSELSSLGPELHALYNRMASLGFVGRSCGFCGSEISQANV